MFKYFLATYGCQMNDYDSNMIAYMLEERGCAETSETSDADFIIVNTCSVRKNAEDSAYGRIKNLGHLKRKHPKMKIAIVGCMAKNHGQDIIDELPFIDFVLGPDNYHGLDEKLFEGLSEEDSLEYTRKQKALAKELTVAEKKAAKKKRKKARSKHQPVVITDFDEEENYLGQSTRIKNDVSSLVAIQRGCNKRCSYCIVPFVRGQEKYRSATDIVREVEQMASKGVKEITLLGQTVNSYKFESMGFAELLVMVGEVSGIDRIRYTSPHPKHYSPDLLEIMKSHPKIMPHAHIPLQSGSDKMLKKMRRQYSAQQFLEIIAELREHNPLFGITTDIITGFVGEDREDFEATLDVVKKSQFDNAFMFSYSPREGTEAFDEVEILTEDVKKARLQELIDVQNKITIDRAELMLGQTEQIMIDGPSYRNSNQFVGKTGSFKKVIINDEKDFSPGDLINVKIIEIKGRTLIGQEV